MTCSNCIEFSQRKQIAWRGSAATTYKTILIEKQSFANTKGSINSSKSSRVNDKKWQNDKILLRLTLITNYCWKCTVINRDSHVQHYFRPVESQGCRPHRMTPIATRGAPILPLANFWPAVYWPQTIGRLLIFKVLFFVIELNVLSNDQS